MKAAALLLILFPLRSDALIIDALFGGVNALLARLLADDSQCTSFTDRMFDGALSCSHCKVEVVPDTGSFLKIKLKGEASCTLNGAAGAGAIIVVPAVSESEPVGMTDLLRGGLSVFTPFWTTLSFTVPEGGSISLDYLTQFVDRQPTSTIFAAWGSVPIPDTEGEEEIQCSYNGSLVECGDVVCFDSSLLSIRDCPAREGESVRWSLDVA